MSETETENWFPIDDTLRGMQIVRFTDNPIADVAILDEVKGWVDCSGVPCSPISYYKVPTPRAMA